MSLQDDDFRSLFRLIKERVLKQVCHYCSVRFVVFFIIILFAMARTYNVASISPSFTARFRHRTSHRLQVEDSAGRTLSDLASKSGVVCCLQRMITVRRL